MTSRGHDDVAVELVVVRALGGAGGGRSAMKCSDCRRRKSGGAKRRRRYRGGAASGRYIRGCDRQSAPHGARVRRRRWSRRGGGGLAAVIGGCARAGRTALSIAARRLLVSSRYALSCVV